MTLHVDISHRFETSNIEIQFDAPPGVTALFGPSGSGKTTVVKAIAGLTTPDSGRIAMDGSVLLDTAKGVECPVHKRRLGLVFQDARLFPHLNVHQNMAYGLRFAPKSEAGPDIEELAGLLDLAPVLNRSTVDLSGGEAQRVAIGRALLSRPRMLLMDEPLASLDTGLKQEILPYLERLRDQVGLPILYVSHSLSEVARLATTVVVLDKGKVAQSGPTEDVLSDPTLVRLFGLRETGSVLPAQVHSHHDDGLTELKGSAGSLFLPKLDLPTGSNIRVRILAHDVILASQRPTDLSALNILEAEIIALREGQGPGMIVQLKCGTDRLLTRITRRSAQAMSLAPGGRVFAVIKSVAVARADVGTG
ncbi:MAG: molybdenum ABC transporter ATP-binding protein [Paracoccaceae bacterium]